MNISPWFITGFVEGEGAFTYTHNTNGMVNPYFSIRQRWDYADMVHAVAQFFGVGKIYDCKAHKQSQANCYFRVHRKLELPIIVAHFDQYPIQSAKKREAFLLWKQIVVLWTNAHGPTKLNPIKEQLEELAIRLSKQNIRPRQKALQ